MLVGIPISIAIAIINLLQVNEISDPKTGK